MIQHDHKSSMTIERSGNFEISPPEELHNNHRFSGEENNITISRTYSEDFQCTFYLHYYPFDVQICHMNFFLEVIYQGK